MNRWTDKELARMSQTLARAIQYADRVPVLLIRYQAMVDAEIERRNRSAHELAAIRKEIP